MLRIRVRNLCYNKPAFLVPETASLCLTDRHLDNHPASGEDDEFLLQNDRLNVSHEDVQKMIHSAMLRYEEDIMRRPSDGMARKAIETLLKAAAKGATEEILRFILGAVKDVVQQAINRGAAVNAIILRLDRVTESKVFEQNILGSVIQSPTLTASISGLHRRHAEIAFMNKVKFYDPSKNAGKKNEEATPPTLLTRRSPAFSASPKHDEKKKSKKKKEASLFCIFIQEVRFEEVQLRRL